MQKLEEMLLQQHFPQSKSVSKDALLACLSQMPLQHLKTREVTVDTVRMAINNGCVQTFSQLDYCVFRIAQEATHSLKQLRIAVAQRLEHNASVTKQQLIRECSKLIADGQDSRWLEGSVTIDGQQLKLHQCTVEQLLELSSQLEQRQQRHIQNSI